MEDATLNSGRRPLGDLIDLIEILRGENGCPWDKQQTPQTMLPYLLEEIYELADAVDSGAPDDVREELGDVLFHIFFIARLYQEMNLFGLAEVAREINAKMKRRHPHVFGHQKVKSSREVKENWQRIKQREKKNAAMGSALDSVPDKCPALMRAFAISERSAKAGFDWTDTCPVFDELMHRCRALTQAWQDGRKDHFAAEIGPLLFTLVHLARRINIHPETALLRAVNIFEQRFKQMEKHIRESGRELPGVSQSEKNALWDRQRPRA
jgi:MazG family protein